MPPPLLIATSQENQFHASLFRFQASFLEVERLILQPNMPPALILAAMWEGTRTWWREQRAVRGSRSVPTLSLRGGVHHSLKGCQHIFRRGYTPLIVPKPFIFDELSYLLLDREKEGTSEILVWYRYRLYTHSPQTVFFCNQKELTRSNNLALDPLLE